MGYLENGVSHKRVTQFYDSIDELLSCFSCFNFILCFEILETRASHFFFENKSKWARGRIYEESVSPSDLRSNVRLISEKLRRA